MQSGNLFVFFSVLFVSLWPTCFSCAGEPTTKPLDAALDWMLSHATTGPVATQPTTAQLRRWSIVNRKKSAAGSITLSDGTKLTGEISTTAGKPRVYDDQAKQYVDVPIDSVASMKAEVVWEHDEQEWQFKLSGSDEKIYSGKTYPAQTALHDNDNRRRQSVRRDRSRFI